MLIAILSVFAWAFGAPFVARLLGDRAGWVLALLPAGLFVWFAGHLPAVADGATVLEVVPWVPGLDVDLSFHLDGLALVFALLILGIGAFIVAYAGGYLKGDPHLPRFYLFILSFMGAMLGLVLSDNLIALFIFWELTSVTSYLLIGYSHTSPASRRAALQALLVTSLGGLAMMAGLILLGLAGGSFELSELTGRAGELAEHALYVPILVLVLAGCFTKSAQFPFHFWLPNAMEAPTPVSAYLHSATMVKAGVYLLARMNPILGGTEGWQVTLVVAGAVTAVLGAVLAVRQTDLKRILAYTTVTALGQLVMLVGIGSVYAMEAFAAYLVAHALYKGALFMGAGCVDHETGTRDIRVLSGLARAMPVTALAMGLAAVSNAGLPPFLGFVGKEFMYSSTVGLAEHGAPVLGWLVTVAMILTNALLLVSAGLVFAGPFLGRRGDTPKAPHEGYPSLWVGALTLALLGLAAGILLDRFETWAVGPVAASIAGEPTLVNVYLWGGLTIPLGLSVATVLLGVLLYRWRNGLRTALDRMAAATGYDSDRGYDRFMEGLAAVATWQARVTQSGYLRHYLAVIFSVVTVAIGGTMLLKGGFAAEVAVRPEASPSHWILALIILAATLATTLTASRLVAILSLGVVGITMALVFLMFGAPDVAITQFMAETLVVIIVALVLSRLPDLASFSRPSRWTVVRDATIALAFGGMVTAVMLAVIDLPIPLTLSEFFAERSYAEAHGRNVVNVILVDFRALDTLGEIAVVVVAGLGAFAVLKAGYPNGRRGTGAEPLPDSLILRTATRLLLSLMLLFSVFILLRGHNEPGGGFIGGLIAASAFALHSIAFGPAALRRLLSFDPRSVAAVGLAAALLSGLLSAFAGDAFLTGLWVDAGALALGTPLLFDIGVYLVVVGAVLTIVLALEEEEV